MDGRHLNRFERLAQHLVEGMFGRLFGNQVLPSQIAYQLALELEANRSSGLIASGFEVRLRPEDLTAIEEQFPHLADQLSEYLTRLAGQSAIALAPRPQVQFLAEPGLNHKGVQVRLTQERHVESPTRPLRRASGRSPLELLQALDAFLIVEGSRHVLLNRPVTTLGRHAGNDIVVDASHVSRKHAQIRWRYGRFVLYDLNSRWGTSVNGQRVSECALYAGDIIRLSDVPIIYGEGSSAHQSDFGGDESQPTLGLGDDKHA